MAPLSPGEAMDAVMVEADDVLSEWWRKLTTKTREMVTSPSTIMSEEEVKR